MLIQKRDFICPPVWLKTMCVVHLAALIKHLYFFVLHAHRVRRVAQKTRLIEKMAPSNCCAPLASNTFHVHIFFVAKCSLCKCRPIFSPLCADWATKQKNVLFKLAFCYRCPLQLCYKRLNIAHEISGSVDDKLKHYSPAQTIARRLSN